MSSLHAEKRLVELPTGRLLIDVDTSDIALDLLCGFAARRNPKRGFLFVSKVLGKHIPVKPSLMRHVHKLLAKKIAANLPGPVVIIGMAETAICLGNGVYNEYIKMTGRQDVVFSHSTRYRLDRPVALEFLEEHSHAAEHIMYLPEDEHNCELYENARSLVLVDDEASTGKTFVNLSQAFAKQIPTLQHVVTAVITDWRGQLRTEQTLAAMPVPSSTIAVLTGEYQFQAAPNLVAVEMPKVTGDNSFKDALIPRNRGRFGLRGLKIVQTVTSAGVVITIFAPTSTCIELENFEGNAQIGQIGDLVANINNSAVLFVKSCNSANLTVNNAALATIEKVLNPNNSLSILVKNGASVQINSGEVSEVNARAYDGALFVFNGEAQIASLVAKDGASIKIAAVIGHLREKESDGGKITVHRRG